MVTPEKVIKGDLIHVVAPAGKVNAFNVKSSINRLKQFGFNVNEGVSLYKEAGSFAGDDEARLYDLQQAFDDSQAKVIMLARGGYGILRIIDRINLEQFQKHPKWVIGFSDNTALLNLLDKKGIATIHGAMPNSLPEDTNDRAWTSLLNLLLEKSNEIIVEPSGLNKNGSINGYITGGNLTLLTSTLGSPTQIEPAGKILFIEDISEYHYQLDRMMTALGRAGVFDNIIGLLVGQLTDMVDGGYGSTPQEIIAEVVNRYNPTCPCAFNIPCGHITSNQSIAFGMPSQITITDSEVRVKQGL